MKITYNKCKHTNALYNITLVCSPTEGLTIMNALRRMATANDTHPKDRQIAERMLAEMRGENHDA